MKSAFKDLIKNNKQVFLLLLFAVQTLGYFMSDFFGLDYHTVHIALDDRVPYLPVFIIPYILWYAYIPLPMIIACFKDKDRFYRQAWTVFTGALMCTVFFYIFPTKIDFRPVPHGNGPVSWLCRIIYSNDTPTNVFPSLHCYQATAIHLSTFDVKLIKEHPWLFLLSTFMMIVTCLSTIFVKQHSVADLIAGCLFGVLVSTVIKICFEKHKKKTHVNS